MEPLGDDLSLDSEGFVLPHWDPDGFLPPTPHVKQPPHQALHPGPGCSGFCSHPHNPLRQRELPFHQHRFCSRQQHHHHRSHLEPTLLPANSCWGVGIPLTANAWAVTAGTRKEHIWHVPIKKKKKTRKTKPSASKPLFCRVWVSSLPRNHRAGDAGSWTALNGSNLLGLVGLTRSPDDSPTNPELLKSTAWFFFSLVLPC